LLEEQEKNNMSRFPTTHAGMVPADPPAVTDRRYNHEPALAMEAQDAVNQLHLNHQLHINQPNNSFEEKIDYREKNNCGSCEFLWPTTIIIAVVLICLTALGIAYLHHRQRVEKQIKIKNIEMRNYQGEN
jgi:hypothetical protein